MQKRLVAASDTASVLRREAQGKAAVVEVSIQVAHVFGQHGLPDAVHNRVLPWIRLRATKRTAPVSSVTVPPRSRRTSNGVCGHSSRMSSRPVGVLELLESAFMRKRTNVGRAHRQTSMSMAWSSLVLTVEDYAIRFLGERIRLLYILMVFHCTVSLVERYHRF